jgi:hypothetical protein
MSSLRTFAHEIAVALAPDGDERAIGARVTQELCGHWEHAGPCRWPHRTEITAREGDAITARVVVACDAEDEAVVRERIAHAVRAGRLDGPTGRTTWRLIGERAVEPTGDEARKPPANAG